MNRENWQQVKDILQSALERLPGEREQFLSEKCAGDDGLRREVETLLNSFENVGSFMEEGAIGAVAETFVSEEKSLKVGKRFAHYKIIEPLGAGGMGEVYLAADTRLGRNVALKVLPAAFASNQDANRRLWREARTAATLEHPNICAIYEIAEIDDCNFIVMQYVEGETLAERLKREKLTLPETLNIAVQVADALTEAHAHGIIHRDIKPANIIVNEKGRAKVLDFGLAKFAGNTDAKSKVTTAKLSSKSGAIMGTVPFMSPEQACGRRLDARTDIFSFGAMLYEMACGRSAFARETDAETISAILRDEPSFTEIPDELQPIVKKCLMKNREERYQTAAELLADLMSKAVLLQAGGLTRRFESSENISNANIQPSATAGGSDKTTQSSAEYIFTEFKRHKLAASVVLIALLTAAIVVVSLNYLSRPTAEKSPAKSIAVLPFKSLNPESGDQFLGLGIADSIIAKTSQINGLTVRPTSAVRKYLNTEIDSLEAAREQKVETVLDGTIQQSGERLRVSVNLLNVGDGSSLWAETFNLNFSDIFKMQNEVSRQIASRLRLKLSDTEAARIAQRDTANPKAYKYFAKAMYHSGNAWLPILGKRSEADLAVELFKRAIELDADYALAHAQLGYTYVRIAVFQEDNPMLIEQARLELAIAERLNPQLGEVHAARYFIAFSQYEGWQVETAFRELRLAQEIDPDVAHLELADLYCHVGLEDKGIEEFEAALRIDPNNDFTKEAYIIDFYQANRPDLALELGKRFYNRGPNLQYYVEKQMAKEAEPLVEMEFQKNPVSDSARIEQIQLMALQGKHDEAQAAAVNFIETVRKNRGYHHYTYYVARVFAQGGKSAEALRWLRYTAENGFPCYPLFERDPYLDPIRKDPELIRFLAEMKQRWEGNLREFG